MSTFNPADAGVPRNQIPRSNFPLDFYRKFTTNFGRLVPFLVEPVMPSDNFEMTPEFILRTSPFQGQVFQQYRVSVDYFYVPNYILWNHFNLFLSGGYDGQTEYVHPYFDLNRFFDSNDDSFYSHFQYLNSLLDYMDISPYQTAPVHEIQKSVRTLKSLFPFASYAKIILDHYTNDHLDLGDLIQENIERGFLLSADGMMNADFIRLMNRLHLVEKDSPSIEQVGSLTFLPVIRPYDYDYFTSALPEQQHGPVMTIPLNLVNTDQNGSKTFQLINDAVTSVSGVVNDPNRPTFLMSQTAGSKDLIIWSNNPNGNNIVVNGSVFNNTATINDFREAARVLEFFEANGLVGWRPEDFHLAQFNMKSSDQSLKKSVRIQHEVFNVNIGEVFSSNVTSKDGFDVPGVATSTAKGYGKGRKASFRCPDYGYIVGLLSVYPDAAYSQGCPSHFDMLDRFDYPNWRFANLGLQPIYNSELYLTGRSGDDVVFGYTTRYADFKTRVNRVNSEFRDVYKYMCSSRLFNQGSRVARPNLNEAFNKVQVNYNDLDRVFNMEFPLLENGPIIIDMMNADGANRPLPYYGDPRL